MFRKALSQKGDEAKNGQAAITVDVDKRTGVHQVLAGHILVVNRKGGRRAFGGADTLVKQLTARFGSTAVYAGKVVFFEDFESVAELAAALAGAALLISPHGAGLTNMLFMSPGAAVIELLPYRCQRVAVFYSTLADRLLLRYSMWQPASHHAVPSLSEEDEEWAFQRREVDEEQCPRSEDRAAWGDIPFDVVPSEIVGLAEHALMRMALPDPNRRWQASGASGV
jgi:hypothetical protein